MQSTLQRILTNRVVLGEYRPRRGARETGEVRYNFYPAVIDEALFARVQDAMKSRGAWQNSKFGGRTGQVQNLFSGIIWNVTDKPLPMHYRTRGKKKAPRLETDRADGKAAQGVIHAEFEKAFLTFLDQLDWESLLDKKEYHRQTHNYQPLRQRVRWVCS